MADYTYTQANFTSSTLVNPLDLQNQINNATLTSAVVQYINYSAGPSNTFTVDIYFNQALSIGDKTTLDTLVANYIYVVYSNISATLTDTRSTGTNGGTFTAGVWAIRQLNTISGSQNFCTLNSNQFTLVPGIYHINLNASACGIQNHQIRLRNITNNLTHAVSSNGYSVNSNDLLGISSTINISTATTYAVQHQCSKTVVDYGYGRGVGFGEPEIYCQVIINNNS